MRMDKPSQAFFSIPDFFVNRTVMDDAVTSQKGRVGGTRINVEKLLPEASTLDLYGIQKATFTHTKNIILKEIRKNDPKKLYRKIMTFSY